MGLPVGPMRSKPSQCESCPAYAVGKSFVPGRGPASAKIAIIGQGPGEVEAYQGRPFVGPSGARLDVWLREAGISRVDCWVDNVVRCWLPNNRKPTRAESSHCWLNHIQPGLGVLRELRVIVPVGIPAMEVILGGKRGERDAGCIYPVEIDTITRRVASEGAKGHTGRRKVSGGDQPAPSAG